MTGFKVGIACMLVAVALFASGCRTTESDAASSRVRAFHLSPGLQPVDVYVDGTRIVAGLAYEVTSGYQTASSGSYQVRVFPAGRTDRSILSIPLTLDPDKDYSIFALGRLPEIKPLVALDDNSPPVPGKTKVRFVHASPDVAEVDIWVQDIDLHLFGDIPFGSASVYQEITPGAYEFVATAAGEHDNVVVRSGNITLNEGRVYTLIASGTADNDTLKLVAYTDK